jgi:hypothetical protein
MGEKYNMWKEEEVKPWRENPEEAVEATSSSSCC